MSAQFQPVMNVSVRSKTVSRSSEMTRNLIRDGISFQKKSIPASFRAFISGKKLIAAYSKPKLNVRE